MKKHIYFILACLTALNVSFSYAAQIAGIHEDNSCPAFDFRDRFGPTQNQGFHQICWAMAGTSLIEEEACLMDRQFCGVNFSAVDIGSCDPRLGHAREFTLPVSTQLEVIVERFKKGRSLALSICPEKFSFIEDMMIPGGDCISGHAIIANAIRRNTNTGACEIHLMDSRKESSTIQFNGWFDLKTVADATIAITQIIPKKDQ